MIATGEGTMNKDHAALAERDYNENKTMTEWDRAYVEYHNVRAGIGGGF